MTDFSPLPWSENFARLHDANGEDVALFNEKSALRKTITAVNERPALLAEIDRLKAVNEELECAVCLLEEHLAALVKEKREK